MKKNLFYGYIFFLLASTIGCVRIDLEDPQQLDAGAPTDIPCEKGDTDYECIAGKGQCSQGFRVCLETNIWDVCQPLTNATQEICDGIDNDCDGNTDNNITGLNEACTVAAASSQQSSGLASVNTACTQGIMVCENSSMYCKSGNGTPEICDNIDNDCNGSVDDGLPACAGGKQACANAVSLDEKLNPNRTGRWEEPWQSLGIGQTGGSVCLGTEESSHTKSFTFSLTEARVITIINEIDNQIDPATGQRRINPGDCPRLSIQINKNGCFELSSMKSCSKPKEDEFSCTEALCAVLSPGFYSITLASNAQKTTDYKLTIQLSQPGIAGDGFCSLEENCKTSYNDCRYIEYCDREYNCNACSSQCGYFEKCSKNCDINQSRCIHTCQPTDNTCLQSCNQTATSCLAVCKQDECNASNCNEISMDASACYYTVQQAGDSTYSNDSVRPALNTINLLNKYRIGAGLPPVLFDTSINNAAWKHALYVNVNKNVENPHNEVPGGEHYKGSSVGDRIQAAGYQISQGQNAKEVISFRSSGIEAIEEWMQTVYHRYTLLDGSDMKIGYGYLLSEQRVQVLDGVTQQYQKPFVLYPYHNQKNIPPRWLGKESPDPTPGDDIRGYNISVIYFDTPSSPANPFAFKSAKLIDLITNEAYSETDYYLVHKETDPGSSIPAVNIITKDPMRHATTYQVEITVDVGTQSNVKHEWKFMTQFPKKNAVCEIIN